MENCTGALLEGHDEKTYLVVTPGVDAATALIDMLLKFKVINTYEDQRSAVVTEMTLDIVIGFHARSRREYLSKLSRQYE